MSPICVDEYARAEHDATRAEQAAYSAAMSYSAARRHYDRQPERDTRAILRLAIHELKYHSRRLARQRIRRDAAERAVASYLATLPRRPPPARIGPAALPRATADRRLFAPSPKK